MKSRMVSRRAAAALALALGLAVGLTAPAAAQTFRWSYQGDVNSLDPMALNESFSLGFQYSFYEPLVGRDNDMKLKPVLATSWENPEPDKWVFHLRQGVTFHNGEPFTADDVIFSWERSKTEGSDMKSYADLATGIRKIDDYTVEVTTPEPNPILPDSWTFLYMMSKSWAEANNTTEASSASSGDNYAVMHENGTGPFIVTEREPDVRTVLQRFGGYWDPDIPTNVTEIVFQPIKQDSTRVAALISGDLDVIAPVPVQDWSRFEGTPGVSLLNKPETRALFIGFDQFRDELLFSNVKGKNPFQDRRVREAFNRAVDTRLINEKIMRGAGQPLGSLIATSINGYDASFGEPYTPDVTRAKELLAEAGYPDGFEVTLDCPNDRYVNDEKICQAVAGMLAQAGIRVDLLAQTKSKFFGKVLPQNGNNTSMYLLGWGPSTVDSWRALYPLANCRGTAPGAGQFNLGGYCNEKIDELTVKIGVETDHAKRNALIKEAFTIIREDYAYLPLLQPPLSWGVRDGVQVQQRADGFMDMRYAVVP